MKWFKNLKGKSEEIPDKSLDIIQAKFNNFLDILHNNNTVLKDISDLEEKLQGNLQDIGFCIRHKPTVWYAKIFIL